MKSHVLIYTILLIGGNLLVRALPAWSGDLSSSEVTAQSRLELESDCKAKKLPALHAIIHFPPPGVSLEDVMSGILKAMDLRSR